MALTRSSLSAAIDRAIGGPARKRVVVLLAAVLALQGADTSTIGAVAAQLEPALHIDNIGLGLLVTGSAATTAVATLPMGALADRVNRSRLLTAAIVLWSIALVISGASNSFAMLLIARLALGVVLAVAAPTVASLVGDLFPPGARGRLYGFVLAGELLGGGLGFLVSGNISSTLGWRSAFWVMAGLSAIVAAALHRWLPEPARGGPALLYEGATTITTAARDRRDGSPDRTDADEAPPPSPLETQVEEAGIVPHAGHVLRRGAAPRSLWWSVRYIVSIRTNLIFIVASALGYSLYSAVRTFGVLFVRERFGVGQSVATLLLIVLGAGAIVGVLLTGRLSDALIARRHLSARPVVAGASFLVAAALFAPALLMTSLLVATPLFFLAAAGVGGANPPLDAARLDLIPAQLWGRAEAVRTALRSLLEAGAPLLVGVLATYFGTPTSGLGQANSSGTHHADGLSDALLVMVAPVVLAGALLLLRARLTYPRDVATAIASDADADAEAA